MYFQNYLQDFVYYVKGFCVLRQVSPKVLFRRIKQERTELVYRRCANHTTKLALFVVLIPGQYSPCYPFTVLIVTSFKEVP